eukprot:301343-Chlamydomonas_euryale.AAC.3
MAWHGLGRVGIYCTHAWYSVYRGVLPHTAPVHSMAWIEACCRMPYSCMAWHGMAWIAACCLDCRAAEAAKSKSLSAEPTTMSAPTTNITVTPPPSIRPMLAPRPALPPPATTNEHHKRQPPSR